MENLKIEADAWGSEMEEWRKTLLSSVKRGRRQDLVGYEVGEDEARMCCLVVSHQSIVHRRCGAMKSSEEERKGERRCVEGVEMAVVLDAGVVAV
ncbi:hypothetical protein HAX54_018525 [Datura stramonium]|uniref:Uncharacterized protein n=1 Tax=Datura stramonium TaxID=4076 RepID=A0ABS8UMQ3_DATST|nr:hypothetical protein [Datura stramonium]